MKDRLIEFETAKLAKEKGFDIPTIKAYKDYGKCSIKSVPVFPMEMLNYNNINTNYWNISAPTQSLLQRWLREKHNIHIPVNWVYKKSYDTDVDWYYNVKGIGLISNNLIDLDETKFNTYEDALEKGLQEALKLIK
tara:strand:+ start:1510 stop:1917 length:408 start_codon:yes stop_codon:yes gene_type:complete